MSRASTLILLGILVIVIPFSGLPISFRTFLLVLFGLGIVLIGVLQRSEHVRTLAQPKPEEVVVPPPSIG